MMIRSKSIGAVDYSQFRAGSSDSKCQGCQGKVLFTIPCHWLLSLWIFTKLSSWIITKLSENCGFKFTCFDHNRCTLGCSKIQKNQWSFQWGTFSHLIPPAGVSNREACHLLWHFPPTLLQMLQVHTQVDRVFYKESDPATLLFCGVMFCWRVKC